MPRKDRAFALEIQFQRSHPTSGSLPFVDNRVLESCAVDPDWEDLYEDDHDRRHQGKRIHIEEKDAGHGW